MINGPLRQGVYDAEIGIQFLRDGARLPQYGGSGDRGADIYAPEDVVIPANSMGNLVKTGLAADIPPKWALEVRPRSGMSKKTKLRISNSPGTIDELYTDEIGVLIDNYSDEDYIIKKGERFAQLILEPNYAALFKQVDDVKAHKEDRGGGFGSTGK